MNIRRVRIHADVFPVSGKILGYNPETAYSIPLQSQQNEEGTACVQAYGASGSHGRRAG